MRNSKLVLLILAVASLSFSGLAADTYAGARTLTLAAPALYSGGGAVNSGTNAWIDIRAFEGIAKIDILACTNVGNSAATVTIQSSDDQTNLTTLSSVSYAVATSAIITNVLYGGTNLTATDVFNLPGTLTAPTASSAGFATPYINYATAPFTNSASAISIPGAANGVVTLGFNIADSRRYMRLIVIPSGAATNLTVGAVITGIKQIVP